MIVGFMAFLLKVIVNAQEHIDHDWYSAIEFADLVIPITSMIYMIIGLLLMYYLAHMLIHSFNILLV